MTTNKPKVVGYITKRDSENVECRLESAYIASDSWPGTVALIRLSDYERLQAECNALRDKTSLSLGVGDPELVAVTSHREAFEAFYAKQLGRSKLSETFSRSGEDYVVSHTQRAWKAWYYGAHHQTQLLTQSGQMLTATPALTASNRRVSHDNQ